MAAKTVDCSREFVKRIVSGSVLDDQGRWVTLAERKMVEEEVLEHLMAGRILQDGKWMTFEEVKIARTEAMAPPEEEREETRRLEA
jgi:hypothetical protein